MKAMLSIQGFFYVLTGLWPLLHLKSFEAVTGPKKDKWLVKTVGLMITCSGLIFLYSTCIGPSIPKETWLLAIMNALCLAAVDIHYARKDVIAKIYLADAAVELFMVGFYLLKLS